MNNKFLIIGAIVIGFIILLTWLFIESSKPLPGVKMLQDGRGHLPEGTKIDYNFNPPTSGNHYPSWITKGFYNEPRSDPYLVHSMEHGYIIFWYDCDKKLSNNNGILVKNVYAQGLSATSSGVTSNTNLQMTGGSEGSPSALFSQLPKSFSDGSCDNLKNQIKDIMKQNNEHKLIAMPGVGLGNVLVLTAWGRADKLNNLDKIEIKRFIDAFRDNGPEATNEP